MHELVDALGEFQVHADVHVKLRRKQAREETRVRRHIGQL
jgi:hypothetical protein